MIWKRCVAVGTIILFALCWLNVVYAIPSTNFTYNNYEDGWYDDWGICRTYYGGSDGFLPNVAYESIGTYKEKAYSIGESMKTNYPDKVDRAEAILSFVQRWTEYGYDEDNVEQAGEYQPEWAWNADEMANAFDQTTAQVAIGDCEDMSFLCSTIYLAAGFDVTIVSPSDHVALMIWLPEYSNPNYYWDLGDGRGQGWIWVEATGEENPLGWTPPDYADGDFEVFPLSSSSIISNVYYSPTYPQVGDDVAVTVSVSSSISQAVLLYSINGGSAHSLTMTKQGSSYKATIPSQTDGTDVDFYVSVTDTQGESTDSSTYSYTVGRVQPTEEPILEIPGFPVESIIVGLIVGFITLYLATKKRRIIHASSFSAA